MKRPRLSILNLLLLVVIVALTVAWVVERRKNQAAALEITNMKLNAVKQAAIAERYRMEIELLKQNLEMAEARAGIRPMTVRGMAGDRP